MKNIYFFLFLILFTSCDQSDTEYVLQYSTPVSIENDIFISEDDCFSFVIDTNSFHETMFYSHKKHGDKQVIDSIDVNGYGSTLNSFKSPKNNSYIIFWKIEHEYFPTFNVYYVKNGKWLKIGEWGVYSDSVEYSDSYDYSIKDIRVLQKNNKIEFSFLKDGRYIDYNENIYDNNPISFKAGTMLFSFDIINEALKQ